MAPRINPDKIKGRPLTPQSPGSYPVDPYNRPPSEGNSNLGRLAQALGDLAPQLQRVAGNAMEGEKKDAQKKAYEDFLSMEATGKAIKAGEMDPAGSPFFNRYYHETLGRLAASRYDSELATASAEALSEATNPAEFDAFAAKFRKAWLKDNVGETTGDFMAGFVPAAADYDIQSRSSFATQASARLQGKAIQALYAKHQIGAQDILRARGGVMDDATIAEMADFMKISNQQQYFLNPTSGRQISKTTIEAVFDLARTQQDPRFLDILKHIDSAIPGATLDTTQDVVSKIQDVRNQIHADIKKDDAFADHSRKQQRQTAIDNAIDGATELLESNPDADLKPFIDSLQGVAPEKKELLYRLKDAYRNRDQQETAAQAGPLFERAFRGTLSFEAVADAFAVGQISKDTAKELRAQIRVTRSGKGSKHLVQDERYTKASSALKQLFQNQMGAYSSPVTSAVAQTTAWQLERDWVRFMMGPGREADPNEVGIWLQTRAGELYAQNVGATTNIGSDPIEQSKKIMESFVARDNAPVLSDWKKTRLVSANFLARIQQEHAAGIAAKRDMRSEPVKAFLAAYRVTAADVEAFLKAQTQLPERP